MTENTDKQAPLSNQIVIDAEHPWPGLMPFNEAASAFFHGRDGEAKALFRLIKRETLSVLFGQSGLGKSSLLNAGLFPRLRQEDFLPVYIRLDVTTQAPDLSAQVFAAIQHNCQQHNVALTAEADQFTTLWQFFHTQTIDFWSARNRLLTPVLVFDQFEEIFTLGRHAEGVTESCMTLLSALADLIENRMPEALAEQLEDAPETQHQLDFGKQHYKVVFCFREDYLPEFEELRTLIRPIMLNRMRISSMSGRAALEAILRSGGHIVQPDVASQIVRFVAAPRAHTADSALERLAVEPALLSVVCRELNNQRLRSGRTQITADLLINEAQQKIIQNYYQSSFAGIDPLVQAFVEDQLLTDAGYRNSYALDDALLIPGLTRNAIDTLVVRRLLRLEDRAGVLRVELTHDVLTSVAREHRDLRRQHQEAAKQRAAERMRKRRAGKLSLLATTAFAIVASIAVLFGVLLNQATEEREKLLRTQSYAMLSRANALQADNTPVAPYAMIAEAIRLYPENRAAITRATALLTQRQNAVLVAQKSLTSPAQFDWYARDRYIMHGQDHITQVTMGPTTQPAKVIRMRSSNDDHADYGLLAPIVSVTPIPETPVATKPISTQAGLHYRYHAASRLIVATSQARKLHLFDIDTLHATAEPIQLDGALISVQISHNRRWLAAVSQTRSLYIVDLNQQTTTRLPTSTDKVEFITDQGVLLTHSGPDSKLYHMTPLGYQVITLAAIQGESRLHPKGEQFAIRMGHAVRLFSIDQGQLIATFPHPKRVRSFAFRSNGRWLATACLDKFARVWDLQTQQLVGPPMKHHGPVLRVQFVPGTKLLASGATDGAVRVWDPVQGILRLDPMNHAEPIQAIHFQPDGQHLLVATYAQQLSLWRWRKPSASPRMPVDFSTQASLLTLSQNGQFMLSMDAAGNAHISTLRVHKQSVVAQRHRFEGIPNADYTTSIFSHDGQLLVTPDRIGRLHLYHTATATLQDPPLHNGHAVLHLQLSHDQALLAVVSDDHAVRLWNLKTKTRYGWRMRHKTPVQQMAFSHDDKLMVTAEQNRVYLWAAGALSPSGSVTFANEQIKAVSFDQGDHHILVVLNNRLVALVLSTPHEGAVVLSTNTHTPRQLTFGRFPLWTAVVSSDGSRIAIGGLYGSIRMIDTHDLRFMGETMQHDDAVLGIQFSEDAQKILSWSHDRSVRVWHSNSGYAVADAIPTLDKPMMARWVMGDHAVAVSLESARLFVDSVQHAPYRDAPDWLPNLLEAVGGGYLDDNGEVTKIRDRAARFETLLGVIEHAAPGWKRWAQAIEQKNRVLDIIPLIEPVLDRVSSRILPAQALALGLDALAEKMN